MIAANRQQSGRERRTVARAFAYATGPLAKPASVVLAAWRRAAEKDPSDFLQWREISLLESQVNGSEAGRAAADTALSWARTDFERAEALMLYTGDETAPGLVPGQSPQPPPWPSTASWPRPIQPMSSCSSRS